jgi:class I fructose-bisphosphate aldolase
MNGLDSETRVVVAVDHGMAWGVLERFENPRETLANVLAAGPDGILAGYPFVRRFEGMLDDYPDVDRVVTLDMFHESTMPGRTEDAEIQTQVFDASEAASVGDAAKIALVYGREQEAVLQDNLEYTAAAGRQCREAGIPLVVEPTLWGQRAEDELDAGLLADATRVAFELGADILKSPYPGSTEEFAPIVENAPVPVYIAGGPATETDREVLEMVGGAVEAGARGVMFGRNVWQRDDPAAIVDAIGAITHDGATVDEAADLL